MRPRRTASRSSREPMVPRSTRPRRPSCGRGEIPRRRCMRRIALKGGTVIDGSGAPARAADVLLDGDAILAVGRFDPAGDDEIVDATGLVVAPGFIDIHSHSDFTLLTDPRAVSA